MAVAGAPKPSRSEAAKLYSSRSEILDGLRPFTLDNNDSGWVASWKKQSDYWITPALQNKFLTWTFSKSKKSTWQAKLEEIHRKSWEKREIAFRV